MLSKNLRLRAVARFFAPPDRSNDQDEKKLQHNRSSEIRLFARISPVFQCLTAPTFHRAQIRKQEPVNTRIDDFPERRQQVLLFFRRKFTAENRILHRISGTPKGLVNFPQSFRIAYVVAYQIDAPHSKSSLAQRCKLPSPHRRMSRIESNQSDEVPKQIERSNNLSETHVDTNPDDSSHHYLVQNAG